MPNRSQDLRSMIKTHPSKQRALEKLTGQDDAPKEGEAAIGETIKKIADDVLGGVPHEETAQVSGESVPRDQPTQETDTSVPGKETTLTSDASVPHEKPVQGQDTNVPHPEPTPAEDASVPGKEDTQVQDTSTPIEEPTLESDTNMVNEETTQGKDTSVVHEISTPDSDTSLVHQTSTLSFHSKAREPKFEDTYTKKTFNIRRDLLKKIEKLSKKNDRGFQTWFINTACELLIAEMEKQKNK